MFGIVTRGMQKHAGMIYTSMSLLLAPRAIDHVRPVSRIIETINLHYLSHDRYRARPLLSPLQAYKPVMPLIHHFHACMFATGIYVEQKRSKPLRQTSTPSQYERALHTRFHSVRKLEAE